MTEAIVGADIDNARDSPIPTQDRWVSAKRKVKLPNGIEMAYLDVGNPGCKLGALGHDASALGALGLALRQIGD